MVYHQQHFRKCLIYQCTCCGGNICLCISNQKVIGIKSHQFPPYHFNQTVASCQQIWKREYNDIESIINLLNGTNSDIIDVPEYLKLVKEFNPHLSIGYDNGDYVIFFNKMCLQFLHKLLFVENKVNNNVSVSIVAAFDANANTVIVGCSKTTNGQCSLELLFDRLKELIDSNENGDLVFVSNGYHDLVKITAQKYFSRSHTIELPHRFILSSMENQLWTTESPQFNFFNECMMYSLENISMIVVEGTQSLYSLNDRYSLGEDDVSVVICLVNEYISHVKSLSVYNIFFISKYSQSNPFSIDINSLNDIGYYLFVFSYLKYLRSYSHDVLLCPSLVTTFENDQEYLNTTQMKSM